MRPPVSNARGHDDMVRAAAVAFPGAKVVDEFDEAEFRRRMTGMFREELAGLSPGARLRTALATLSSLAGRTNGNLSTWSIRMFEDLCAKHFPKKDGPQP